jgi:N-acetylglucosaminyldiphosphoundecaprenol N-acetyl-beta-D-mannosaminyltransferase
VCLLSLLLKPPMVLAPPRQSCVFTVPVHLLEDYGQWLAQCLDQNQGGHVVTLNSEMVMLAEKEPKVHQIISQAELVVPDGAGVTLYLKLEGIDQRRCPGIELAEQLIIDNAQEENPRLIAFYGGAPGVAERAAQRWRGECPHLNILVNHGFLSPEEQELWLQTLKEKQPPLIFVGLGVPRQEYWIAENRHLCPQSWWIGVGGSFDVWSGAKERAPQWFCENNLEWLYRLYQEPWRWRRMLALPHFLWRTVTAR